MKFASIFKDNNDWNEKTIIGFLSFAVMVIVMIADVVSGAVGKDLVINEFTYDSFTLICLGSFGIAGLENSQRNENQERLESNQQTRRQSNDQDALWHCHSI